MTKTFPSGAPASCRPRRPKPGVPAARWNGTWRFCLRREQITAVILAFFWLVSIPADIVLAHAHYARSTPSIGQVLSAPPAQVDIYTDSDMRKAAGGNVIMVAAADGSRVDDGNTIVDDANRQHFSVALQPNLPNGRYVVSFKTLSDVDGDSDSGHFAFYVGSGPTAAQKQLDDALSGPPVSVSASPQTAGTAAKSAIVAPVAIGVVAIAVVLAAWLIVRWRKHRTPIRR